MFNQLQRRLMDTKEALCAEAIVNKTDFVRLVAVFHNQTKQAELSVFIHHADGKIKNYSANINSDTGTNTKVANLFKHYLTTVYGESVIANVDNDQIIDIFGF